MKPFVSGLVPAAGRGQRMGGRCKALIQVDGEPALARIVRVLAETCDEILVGVRQEEQALLEEMLSQRPGCHQVRWVAGGADRNATILNLARAARGTVLVVHDVARPGLELAMVRALEAARGPEEASCVGISCGARDAVGLVMGGLLRGALPKSQVFRLQTPVIVPASALINAMEAACGSVAGTDNGLAILLQEHGVVVRVLEFAAAGEKLTFPGDVPPTAHPSAGDAPET